MTTTTTTTTSITTYDYDPMGTSGTNAISGTAGSDKLFGGAGNDVMDGGAGSDDLKAGSGNDVMIYNLSANLAGAKDVYTGGSGLDTVRMQLTMDQWTDPAVRDQLRLYVAHLAKVQRNTTGEVSNGIASDFVFNFAGGTSLTVQMTERLEVHLGSGTQYSFVDYRAALIKGTLTGAVIEAGGLANAAAGNPTASGQLSVDDLDGLNGQIVSASGTTTYGTYSVSAGVWTYTLNNAAADKLNVGQTADSFIVKTADGGSQTITVLIAGTNDSAVITGTATASLTETDAAQSTGGTITATDVDGSAAFVVQTAVAGSNKYGKFSIDAAGVWTYTMDSAQNQFVKGTEYTDSITVATADGTEKVLTVTITGTNDAAVITGTATASLTETDAAQSTGGTITATDVDGSAAFVVQTAVAGSNKYGKFSIDAAGVWTYTMDSAQNQFVKGTEYTDSITVATADGTEKVLTVTITGTNDAAVITGTATASLTETDAAQSTGGTITATDVDGSAAFVVQTAVAGSNKYGKFSIDAAGVWTYTMDSAQNQFVKGTEYTDSITVATADGTEKVLTVTITGTNDAAVISGTKTGTVVEATASNVGTPTVSGTLTSTDLDNPPANTFNSVAAGTATASGYGTFSVSAAGVWTYSLNNANPTVDALNTNATLPDSFNVTTADGTTQKVDITIQGTSDVVNHAPTDIVFRAVPVGDNLPGANATLATMTTIDADANDTFSYSFAGAPGIFSISGSSLGITSALAEKTVYTVEIRTTDQGGLAYREFLNVITGDTTGNGETLTSGVTDDILYGLSNNGEKSFDILISGDGNDTLFGQDGKDNLQGGAGNDTLYGGKENDILQGGSGADSFVFDTGLASAGIDSISDFASGTDKIVLYRTAFSQLPTTNFAGAFDILGDATAQSSSTRIVYNQSTGALSYDADGNGNGPAVQFATLVANTPLVASDFTII